MPERVFPLLCPVREYDWIPGWRATLLHSESGLAEADCVFRTDLPEGGRMTWVVSGYTPPSRIEFTCFAPDRYIMRLNIDVVPVAEGPRLTWTRRWIATDPAGKGAGEANSDEELDAKMAALERLLGHYLCAGTMLRP